MEKQIVLILGKGGREHALARKCSKSPLCKQVYVIPGNDGMKNCATVVKDIDYENPLSILNFAIQNKVTLTIVGDEMFLEKGVVDLFDKNQLKIFGPTKEAAKIESSKIFAKNIFEKYNIPTADFIATDDKEVALNFLNQNKKYPIVIKNDGLASGKGVFIINSLIEAKNVINSIFDENIFNNDNCGVVIEEFLEGKEFSLLAIVNNNSYLTLQPAKDYKKIFDNDLGSNTGGMGCYTPVDYVTKDIINFCNKEIIEKTIKALKNEGINYKGVLYAGLMLTNNNEVKVIEFNSRFGDPETEVLMPAMKSDLVEVILNILDENILEVNWHNENFVGVTIASEGYPGDYKTNIKIANKNKLINDEFIYHMGTKYNEKNDFFESNGGRVLFIVNKDINKSSCINNLYKKIEDFNFNKFYYRKDIGK
ncbi:phosphoribosylamine--glycine ligase [Spiroplasma turonicum]|uniref:Phosphoribosylamine--glycine ligase n=1 Tax=Spiroplasma turonicum TaxID=216946 RepID=A0A0K1P7H5_9MOLU|nr:phosphoribosylamine--glycine ligase [Spiroplasma turonicum]AKU80230.1 hypothetical protein STURON_00984 [Spiroplasma turonicum]ALX71230.1 phosphoribosylamine--glycine ligase [Spiroplasma turonicum]